MLKNKFPIFSSYFSERQKCFLIPSALFAGFALLYRPLKLEESLCPLYESGGQIAKTLFLFTIYTILFYYAITFLYNYLNRLNPEERAGRFSYPQKAALLGLIWLPHIIAAYPASIPPDTETQLIQFMGYEPFTAHHPPVHTCLIGICTQLGGWLFHSYNIGLFFALILQYIAMLLIFTYTIHYLEKRKAPVFILRFQWAVYSLSPLIIGFVGVVLKDVIYSAFFVLFIIFCADFAENPSFSLSLRNTAGLVASGICVILLRNNGKYVIYPMCLLLFVMTIAHHCRNRKQWARALCVLVLPAAVSFLILNSLTLAYCIAPGSIREALSFPFQQTARTVSKHSDELPEEEKEAIDQVLDYSKIGRRYDYKICDPVKATYREEASGEDLLNYFKIWAKQSIRHPSTYLTATLMQNYPLLCLFDDNSYYYYSSNASYNEVDIITPVPAIEKINHAFYQFYGMVHKIPILGWIAHASFYCILLFILTAYVWSRKKYRLFLPLLPLWLSFGICILAPAVINNARYAFPICYSIPFLFGCYTVHSAQGQITLKP